jgi:NDP-hexose-3-ketoreductase
MNIGVLGCSSIADKSVIPAIIECENTQLLGVASRDSLKAEHYASKYDTIPHSYQELIDGRADAIYVSLPISLHYEWGKRVLESGKHLLMEKTFAQTSSQASELYQIARDKNLICMEALMYKFHPMQKKIEKIASSIGEIRHVEAYFGFPHFEDPQNIRYQKELGGGAIYDLMVYPLSFVFDILGLEYRECKKTVFYDSSRKIDEYCSLYFEYPEATANISFGFGRAYRNEAVLWGTDKVVKVDRAFTRPSIGAPPIRVYADNQILEEVIDANHFVEMLKHFSSLKRQDVIREQSTLERIKFMEDTLQ